MLLLVFSTETVCQTRTKRMKLHTFQSFGFELVAITFIRISLRSGFLSMVVIIIDVPITTNSWSDDLRDWDDMSSRFNGPVLPTDSVFNHLL